MTTRLDLSIGPVQGFVTQSRRTRDLWGSSYLLAFLSAHAMRGAHEAGGEIVQPVVTEDRLYRWVSGDRSGSPPRIGTVPNHFVVKLEGDARPVAGAAVAALGAAWRRVCDAVWGRYVAPVYLNGNETEAIWQRQVRAFWDLSWTACPWSDGRNPLARRKHWRTHRPPDEPGDKCTVMHDLQELSGYVRARQGRQQDEFWGRVAHGLGTLDLRADERLCAVALVKRLFPKVARDALGWPVDASQWPSTVYVGAVPWMRRVMNTLPDQAREYAAAVRLSAPDDVFPMQRPPFSGLNAKDAGDFPKLGSWRRPVAHGDRPERRAERAAARRGRSRSEPRSLVRGTARRPAARPGHAHRRGEHALQHPPRAPVARRVARGADCRPAASVAAPLRPTGTTRR